jgi:ubiquinone/menaquinone biosynthesis C-methylase UbiE
MAIYRDHIFPRLLEIALGGRKPMEYRRRVLTTARGQVLEIGFGTGLNLACYPETVEKLTLLDVDRLLPNRVQQRIAATPFPVEMAFLDAARLPFDDACFDVVVSTWTLCTIPDVASALAEVRRVLRPGGEPHVARRQDRWNGVQKFVACGCNLNRPIDQLVSAAGLRIAELDRFQMPGVPKIGAAHYLGAARHA